jgi:hypothetical protein
MEDKKDKCRLCGKDIGYEEGTEPICIDCIYVVCMTKEDRIIPDQLPCY